LTPPTALGWLVAVDHPSLSTTIRPSNIFSFLFFPPFFSLSLDSWWQTLIRRQSGPQPLSTTNHHDLNSPFFTMFPFAWWLLVDSFAAHCMLPNITTHVICRFVRPSTIQALMHCPFSISFSYKFRHHHLNSNLPPLLFAFIVPTALLLTSCS
jgi:hypothetical protein